MTWVVLGAAFAFPLLISLLLNALLLRLAPRLGLVDHPNERKVHLHPTPRAGGIAIVLATMGTALLLPLLPEVSFEPRFFLALPIFLLGLADDLRSLPWYFRLGVQTLLAFGAVLLFRPAPVAGIPEWLLASLGVVWIVGLTNAFNMLDNMDALTGGVTWIAAGGLAVMAGDQAHLAAWPFLALMGAVSGFLWFNRPPARLFMGDGGSNFLGFVLGVVTLRPGSTAAVPWWIVSLGLLTVPWYDLVTVVLVRLRQRRSPFHPDKQHLSHRLVAIGLSPPRAVGVIHLLALLSGIGAILLARGGPGEGWLVGSILAGGWLVVAVVDRWLWVRRNDTKG